MYLCFFFQRKVACFPMFINLQRCAPTILHAFLGIALTKSTVSVVMDSKIIQELIDVKGVRKCYLYFILSRYRCNFDVKKMERNFANSLQ